MQLKQPKFVGVGTLAKLLDKSPVTIQRKLRACEITADAEFVCPRGRQFALFEESRLDNLALILRT